MSDIFSKQYEVHYYDCDYRLKCNLPSLVNFFCDIGNAHSESVGDTIPKLIENNMVWVFYKYDIKVKRYPNYREKVKVETFAMSFNKFYAHRGYRVIAEDGEVIAEAVSLFFLINIKRRRPMRIPDREIELYGAEGLVGKEIDMDKIPEVEREDVITEFNIRYSDIDSNGHVNNVKYMEWAIESVPQDIVKDHELKRIRVDFDKETTYGNKVTIATDIIQREDKIITIHSIRENNDKELTKLQIEWE